VQQPRLLCGTRTLRRRWQREHRVHLDRDGGLLVPRMAWAVLPGENQAERDAPILRATVRHGRSGRDLPSPSVSTFRSTHERTPDDFRFAVKLPGSVTHVPAGLSIPDDLRAWRESIEPLVEHRKLACGVAQFPNSFKPGPKAEEWLQAIRGRVEGSACR
jgi:hypothetical protein